MGEGEGVEIVQCAYIQGYQRKKKALQINIVARVKVFASENKSLWNRQCLKAGQITNRTLFENAENRTSGFRTVTVFVSLSKNTFSLVFFSPSPRFRFRLDFFSLPFPVTWILSLDYFRLRSSATDLRDVHSVVFLGGENNAVSLNQQKALIA